MGTLWFTLVAFMLTVYVVLDGFDLGAGIIHHIVGKNELERRQVLRAIGPVWDGNEVWLLATGGTLFFAFPALYAASFSGFYLPLMMVLWLLMLRGIGIELRGHSDNHMWRSFFDTVFCFASLLLAIFFGAAIGNVMRGAPLNAEGYFFEPLWTDFTVGPQSGILDWYTILTGLLASIALVVHGARYIAVKTSNEVCARARRIGLVGGWVLAVFTILSLVATVYVRPQVLDNYKAHWWGAIFPLLVVSGLAGMQYFSFKERDKPGFISSTLYLLGMLGGAAFGLFPYLLPATTDPHYGLTIYNAATDGYGLKVGLVWWLIGIVLAIGYFTYLYRSFSGKVQIEEGEIH